MRFYVPEWDDAVDANYDFEHDELSCLDRRERNLDYIWDIFEHDTTPIDGVLISREQVETTTRKANRLKKHGVYDDPVLSVPEWLPTISDCGAWGYKSYPFPPYGNAEMLNFYEKLEVTVGVTIDHLVLGSGKDKGRLYLDKRAFHDEFKQSDIPDDVSNVVDLMIDEWPTKWPAYVEEYEPTIRTGADAEITPFSPDDFQGDIGEVLARLAQDPRAVYREDDKEFRYELTLNNAQEMYELYQNGDYPFRLMVAIQGWTPESYIEATEEVLEIGYNYLGIGGVAGSPIHEVRKIVKGVGKNIKLFERENNTRIDSHVFGFAKTEGFDIVGRSGITSFDSASMLRSAWTGGENYRLDNEKRYDAIRVRYPSNRDEFIEAVEKSLRGRETLVALRAYAADESIVSAIQNWHDKAAVVLPATREYLQQHRHDAQYEVSRLRDIESALRDDFEHAEELQASFSDKLRRKLIKLLRRDDPEDPVAFSEYDELLDSAAQTFEAFPRMLLRLQNETNATPYDQIWTVIEDYATWIGDEDLLEEYQETLQNRPWEKCDCPICTENGIEVCIFRGNDRNRRRGFHNTYRFYNEFATALPKTLVAIQGTASLNRYETVEDYLRETHPQFWRQVHDLPVAEIGVLDAEGIQEWWEKTPDTLSFSPTQMAENLQKQTKRYQQLILYTPDSEGNEFIKEAADQINCNLQTIHQISELRETILEACGRDYAVGDDFVPHAPKLDTEDGLDILIIDQCSGSKEIPENAPIFDEKDTLQFTKEQLLNRSNVPGIGARDLYTGRQQESITEATRQLESQGHAVERYFVSAGFGIVAEDEPLPPYEATFSSMNVSEIRERSLSLNIQQDLSQILQKADYDLVFFTLGKDYYTSIDIDAIIQEVRADRIGVVFNRELLDEQFDNIISIPARTEDAKNHGTIVVGLKGHYLENFACRINETEYLEPQTVEDLCRRVKETSTQAVFGKY